MSMTCKKTIDRAIELLGAIGITAHGYSYQESSNHHKDAHCIRVNRSTDILKVAEALRPYSVTKREQWELVIELCKIKISRRRVMSDGMLARGGAPASPITMREFDLYHELRELNNRSRDYRGVRYFARPPKRRLPV